MNNRKSEKLLSALGELSDDLVLSAAQEKEIILRTRKPRWAAVLVTAVLALIFAVGAAAAGGHIPVLSDLFAPAFYYGEEGGGPDVELLEKVGQPIGVSVEEQGVTVTLRSMLRDRYTLTLVLNVHKKGIEREEFLFDWNRLIINDSWVVENGGSGFVKYGVRGDNAIDYVMTWHAKEPIPTGKIELVLEDASINFNRMFGQRRIEGNWSLEFEAEDTEDLSWEIPAGQHTTMDGAEAVLDEIILSPLSLTVKYTAERELDPLAEGPDHPDYIITLKEGTKLFNNGWYRQEENTREDGSVDDGSIYGSFGDSEPEGDHFRYFYSAHFSRLVPLEDVVSLVIEGQEIPLE